MKQKYEIQIKSKGDYEEEKKYYTLAMLEPKEFLALSSVIINFLETKKAGTSTEDTLLAS